MGEDKNRRDGGWGWFVVAAGFCVHVTTSAMAKCFGVLFVDFQEEFSCSAWALTTVQGTSMALWLGLAPISNALAMRFTSRKVVFVGGVIGTLGFVGSSVASSFPLFFVFQGIIVGFGYGLAYSPTVVMVAVHFNLRRGLAMSVAQSGVGFGSIVVPVVIRYLVDEYGLRGAVLIQAGFMANICVSAMLMRPLTFYGDTEVIVEKQSPLLSPDLFAKEFVSPSCDLDTYQTTNENDDAEFGVILSNSMNENPNLDIQEHDVMLSESDVSHRSYYDYNKNRHRCTTFCSKYFRWSLFRNPLFLIYLISAVSSALTWEVSYTMLSSLAIDRQFSRQAASFLPAMLGFADFVARIFIGPFSDLNLIPRHYIFSTSVVLTGINSMIVPFTYSYMTLAVSSVFYGIFGAFDFVLASLVLTDVLGVENCSNAFGFVSLFQAVGIIIVAQIIGALHDVTGSWYVSFWFTAALSIVGGSVSYLDPVVRRFKNAKCGDTVEVDETIPVHRTTTL